VLILIFKYFFKYFSFAEVFGIWNTKYEIRCKTTYHHDCAMF